MKFFISIAILLSAIATFANQLTVSNVSSSPAMYTVIQDAIDAAADNDTILVQGSPTAYGEVHLTKTIHLYGSGHHPASASGLASSFTTLFILPETAGSLVEGFTINSVNGTTGGSGIFISDIVIRNCFIDGFNIFNTSYNLVMEGNVISGSVGFNGNPNSEALFRNNIFRNHFQTPYGQISGIHSAVVFDHNDFISVCPGCYPFGDVTGAIITNNFFQNYDTSVSGATATNMVNCIMNNNATYLCTTPMPAGTNTGSGNIDGMNPMFINYLPLSETWDWAYDFHTEAGSPLNGAATDGTDIGIYGNFPFHMSGEPFGIPVIREFSIDNTAVPLNGTINVHFEASSPE